MSEATIEEIGAAPCLPFPSIVKMDNGMAANIGYLRKKEIYSIDMKYFGGLLCSELDGIMLCRVHYYK